MAETSWFVALCCSALYWAATGSRWAALAAIVSYLVCTNQDHNAQRCRYKPPPRFPLGKGFDELVKPKPVDPHPIRRQDHEASK